MKNVLVTGSQGQLGYDLVKELYKREYIPICPTKEEMDITQEIQTKDYILNSNCDAIIHCAAYTNVDKAEEEIDLCMKVNGRGTKNIAKCANILNIPMIYISTDYVFDGNKENPYNEDDNINPINIYGKSKYIGEQYVRTLLEKYFIVRISWVFGINGKNFIKTMLNLSNTKETISVINDQIGSPTYTKDISRLLVDMIESEKYGTYHATNEGYCTWYELAKTIFKIANKDINLIPITTNEYKSKAKRPLNSKLSKDKLKYNNFNLLPNWKFAVEEYIKEVNNS